MESYLKSNGKLMESGKTSQQLKQALWWDKDKFGISDSGQTFDNLETRRSKFENWHYAPGLNSYFKTERGSHGLVKAFETLFSTERWEEIEHLLDEMDIHRLLDLGNLSRLKKKIIRARNNGLITSQEITLMAQVVNGD